LKRIVSNSRPPAIPLSHVLLLSFLFAQTFISFVPTDIGVAAANLSISMDFELDDNRVLLPVRFGDSPELRIILDTGMRSRGVYLFRRELSSHLDPDRRIQVRVGGAGSGEASHALMEDSTTIFIGGHTFTGQMVIVSQSGTTQQFKTDGVVGYSLFGSYAVEIDYDELVIRLHDPDEVSPDSTWRALPLELQEMIPFLETGISIAGEDPIPLRTYIDLAAREPLELLVRPGMKFSLPDDLGEKTYLGTGLSGDIYGRKGKIKRLDIGPFALIDVPANFPPAEVRSKQKGADAILGAHAIRRFNVIFDYNRSTLYLKPNTCTNRAFE
jgi:hypothetical protein